MGEGQSELHSRPSWKIPFIDGSYTKPDAGSPLLPYWQTCNDMVLSWLLNSLHKNIRDSVIFFEKASDMWKKLEERYEQSNKARLFLSLIHI